jgi:hypothetical protein
MRTTLVLTLTQGHVSSAHFGGGGVGWGHPCGIFRSSAVAAIAGFDFIEKGESQYAMTSPLLLFCFFEVIHVGNVKVPCLVLTLISNHN